MDASLGMLNIVRMAMLASVLLYALIAERVSHPSGAVADSLLLAIAVVALMILGVCVALRRKLIVPQEEILRAQPENRAALRSWKGGYLALMAMSESVALFGLVLRLLGAPLLRAAPFYAAAICLLLFFGPRRP